MFGTVLPISGSSLGNHFTLYPPTLCLKHNGCLLRLSPTFLWSHTNGAYRLQENSLAVTKWEMEHFSGNLFVDVYLFGLLLMFSSRIFTASGSSVRSLIHCSWFLCAVIGAALILLFCRKTSGFPAQFVEDPVFPPVHVLWPLYQISDGYI